MKSIQPNIITCVVVIYMMLNGCSKSSNPPELSGKGSKLTTANSPGSIGPVAGDGFNRFSDFFKYVNAAPEIYYLTTGVSVEIDAFYTIMSMPG